MDIDVKIGSLWKDKRSRIVRVEEIIEPAYLVDSMWAKCTILNPAKGTRSTSEFGFPTIAKMKALEFDNDITLSVLKRARALLSTGWCQGNYATNKNGKRTSDTGPDAAAWSADGAICRAYFETHEDCVAPDYIFKAILPHIPRETEVHKWNDEEGMTQKKVISAFDKAIYDLELIVMAAEEFEQKSPSPTP